MPFTWLLIVLLLMLITKNQKRLRKLVLITFCAFILFSNSFIVAEFIRMWEYNMTPTEKLDKSYDVGIVLGGGMVQIDKGLNRIIFRTNTDRILQALALYKEGRIKKIMVSSGSGTLFDRYQNESLLLKKYLIMIGVPQQDIITDSLSDNTRQNAVESSKILRKEFPNGKYLLITSAIHMRRAMACFREVKLEPTPFATNKITGPRKFYFDVLFIPNIDALNAWSALAHEVFGYLIYAVMGYI